MSGISRVAGALKGKTRDFVKKTTRSRGLGEQRFYYLLVVAFGLFFVLPILGLIIFAYEYGFFSERHIALYFLFVLVFYYIGFFILRTHADKIRRVSKTLERTVTGDQAEATFEQTSELDRIVVSFQHLLGRVEENEQKLKERADQLRLFGELTTALSEPVDVSPLLELSLQKACQGIGAESGSVLLLDESRRDHFRVASSFTANCDSRWHPGVEIPFGETKAGQAVLQGRPLFLAGPIWQEESADSTEEISLGYGEGLVVPLVTSSEIIGVMCLERKQGGFPFSPADLEFILPVASCLSYRYENLRLKQLVTAHSDQFSCFSNLNRICNSGISQGRLFQIALHELRRCMPVKLSFLALFDNKREYLELFDVAPDETPLLRRGTRLPVMQTLFKDVLRENREIHRTEVAEALHPLEARWARDVGIRSCYVAPFRILGVNAGILFVGSESHEGFSSSEQVILQHLSDYLALGIHNNLLMQQINECNRELETVNRLSGVMSSPSASLDEFLNRVGTIVDQMIAVEAGAIYLREDDTVVVKRTFGASAPQIKLDKLQPDEGICGYVMSRGESVLVRDVSQNPHITSLVADYGPAKTRSILCVPVVAGDEVFGAILLWNRKYDSFTMYDEKAMKWVAATLATVLASTGVQNRNQCLVANEAQTSSLVHKQ